MIAAWRSGPALAEGAVVGLPWAGRRLWKRLLRAADPQARYALAFFEDYEQAKLWLVR
jgi:hypothetical protein